jgi:hypothetical protein
LEKAERRLAAYAPEHLGVDIGGVLEQVRAAVAIVEEGSLELPAPQI